MTAFCCIFISGCKSAKSVKSSQDLAKLLTELDFHILFGVQCLHCTLAVAQCIVISPLCLWVGVLVCVWVCYHDNSKLHALILTKLGFQACRIVVF